MSALIPDPKPAGFHTDRADGTFSYACSVPGCGEVIVKESKGRANRAAKEHREGHRTALTSGGGDQSTIFDVIGSDQ